MVDPDKIRMLVEMMSEHDLSEICWRSGEEEILLKRPGSLPPATENPNLPPPPYAAGSHEMVVSPAPMAMPPLAPPSAPELPAKGEEDAHLVLIESPMVGTLYVARDPQTPPFVTVGSQVTADTVVCIIEAMKVFNEIKAEASGTIEKVLIKNEEPVEYGQSLFMVKPN